MAGSVHPDKSADAAGARAVAASRPTLWLSLPWVAILFITGVFHLYRGVPIDAVIFLLAGVALAADTAVQHIRPPVREHPRHAGRGPADQRTRLLPRWWWAASAAAAGALSLAVAVLAPASSAGIPAVVGLVGAAMLLMAWPDPPRRPGRPARGVRRAAYWWAGVVLFLCIWELGTYFMDRFAPADTAAFPPLTDLLQPLFDSDSSRWFMTALWLVACGALLRVVRRP